MTTNNRLPSAYKRAFTRAAIATDALAYMAMTFDPRYNAMYDNFLEGAAGPVGAVIADLAVENGTGAATDVANTTAGLSTFTSGTSDNGYSGSAGIYTPILKGDNGFYVTSEQKISVLTTAKLEVGVTDAVGDAGAVNVKATPTGTADDFCVLILDTDDNTELDLISEIDNGGPSADEEDVYTLVADTYFRTEFKGQADAIGVYVNGDHVGSGSAQGGTGLVPWWFVQSRAGTASRVLTLDWVFYAGLKA